MTSNNIFSNDILSGDLTTSLVPELGQENILIDVTPSQTSLIDPLNQELSLTESEQVIDEIERDNNSPNNNTSLFDNIAIANIDPFIAANPKEFQVSEIDINNASFALPPSQLTFQGGFGDVDGGNDVTLEIKDNDGNIVETFKLTGEGQASLYRDEQYQYILFSGTDETTNVDIDSTSNIKFGNYIGDSLKIETSGSIEGGDIILNEPDETGLSLISKPGVTKYTITYLGANGAQFINSGKQILVDDYFRSYSNGRYIYDRGERISIDSYEDIPSVISDLSPTYIGEGSVLTSEGIIDEWGSLPLKYVSLASASPGSALDVNSSGQVVGSAVYSSYNRTLPVLLHRSEAIYLFNSNVGRGSSGLGTQSFYTGKATAINDSGLIAGELRGGDIGTKVFVGEFGEGFTILDNISGIFPRSIQDIDINNSGQIIGTYDRTSDLGLAFFSNEGEIVSIGLLPGATNSRAYAINNLGQAVGTAFGDIYGYGYARAAYIYENGETSNLNYLLSQNSRWYLEDAIDINDEGQIIAVGDSIDYGYGRVLLDPIPAESTGENISIGNITTFGDTVLLQGEEITLAGNAITTAGGEITFDGATKVNSNLIIDSSVTEDGVITDGGDITFTNTLNSASAASGNLRLQAGTGNVLFSDTVGGEASFVDLAVEGADTVTINNDLAVDGNLSLEVINDITTANLSAAGLVNISLGKVGDEIYPSTGNVTTGNIDALGLEVVNNGNFTAGNLTTTDGDINVISLNQLNVGQLSATNGAIDLISGTAGININGAVQGDNGFIALAQQDIVTNEITSSQDAVILKSSQGTVTINGSVTAFDDASLAAANNLTVGAVTSQDSSVALISAAGTVALSGTISSMEDVTVASAQSLNINQEIKAELGSIALGSTEGSVTTSVAIDSAIGVNIAAKQNVSTKRIRTYGGDVVINAQQGTTTIGGLINSRGGDIRVSGFNTVRTKNIISRSGDVSIISDTSLVRTGYIRTDRGNRNGDVYLEAGRNVRVGGAFEMDDRQYSIYAGDDGLINVAYQQNKQENKRAQFVVGSPTGNGTLALVTSPVTTPITTPPLGGGVQPNPVLIYIEVFRRVLDAGGTAPRHQSEINPITAKPYLDEAEFELVEQLTPEQEEELRRIINSQDPKFAPFIPNDLLNKGKVDTRRGCFSAELVGHLGSNPIFSPEINPEIIKAASDYATKVSGSPNDFLVLDREGTPAYYDGLVNNDGAATNVMTNISGVPKVVETKYGYPYLNKFIKPDNQVPPGFRPSELSYDPNFKSQRERIKLTRRYEDMKEEIEREAKVAINCELNYAVIFSNRQAYLSALELFNYAYSKQINRSVDVYRIRA